MFIHLLTNRTTTRDNAEQAQDQPLFASHTLHDGRIIKIYGYMPALELKKLLDECTKQVRENPEVEIKDVYN